MNEELLDFFGQLIKVSRNSGIDVLTSFKEQKPKNPSEEQEPLLKLLNSLNPENQKLLEKSVKYCIELSLFKIINMLEYGVSDYSFDLTIKKGDDFFSLIDDEVDNDLTGEYWNWIEKND